MNKTFHYEHMFITFVGETKQKICLIKKTNYENYKF